MKKYIAYYRVSTKRQGESGLGLESQKAIVEHFAKDAEIINSYTDVLSGGTLERPELQKAIAECKKHGYTLIVAKVDRLSRTTEHALQIYSELNERLVSCDVPNLDKFTLTIFMAIADRERELIRIRIKAALKIKKREYADSNIKHNLKKGDDGFLQLGNAEKMTDKGRKKAWKAVSAKAAKNENNMRAVMLICEYKDKGMTLQAIAEKLNVNGFKTSQGAQFQKVTVKRLHERYCKTTA